MRCAVRGELSKGGLGRLPQDFGDLRVNFFPTVETDCFSEVSATRGGGADVSVAVVFRLAASPCGAALETGFSPVPIPPASSPAPKLVAVDDEEREGDRGAMDT